MTVQADGRRSELAAALATVRNRISAACTAAGRDERSVTLVVVTKTYPVDDVVTLAGLGVADFGESRDQEASMKVADAARLLAGPEAGDGAGAPVAPAPDALRWHFVGGLQSRKCRSVASYAHAVHSLDRLELVRRLADGVRQAGRRPLEVFVQLSVDGDPARGGVRAAEVAPLADAVASDSALVLRGVMAVAPLGTEPEAAFADLAAASRELQRSHPHATSISAGMSADLAAAIGQGSTHVRVGTALLGRRESSFG